MIPTTLHSEQRCKSVRENPTLIWKVMAFLKSVGVLEVGLVKLHLDVRANFLKFFLTDTLNFQ